MEQEVLLSDNDRPITIFDGQLLEQVRPVGRSVAV